MADGEDEEEEMDEEPTVQTVEWWARILLALFMVGFSCSRT